MICPYWKPLGKMAVPLHFSCMVLIINTWKEKKDRKTGYPHKRHIWTNTRHKPTRFINHTLPSHSARALNPVAVVTFPLYTMAERLHNVFLPVQFVAHTTAEWAGNTPNYPPTLHPMLMKSWPDWGVFIRHMEASEPEVCPATNCSHWLVWQSFQIIGKQMWSVYRTDSNLSANWACSIMTNA